MNTYRIAVLPGDGIGPEVTDATMCVLNAVGLRAEYIYGDIGWAYWQQEGNALPERTIELLKTCDAALLGAITSKPASDAENELSAELRGQGLIYRSPVVQLRQVLELDTAVRPCRSYPGLRDAAGGQADIVVFRENTEGLYGGIEWRGIPEQLAGELAHPDRGHPGAMQRFRDIGLDQVALSTRFVSEPGCERVCRRAFAYAAEHGRKRVSLLDKPNVLRETGVVMAEAFSRVADEYPWIEAEQLNIDAACMNLVLHPQHFDVIVAENMFGDIVSDLVAGLTGGIGFAPSANIGEHFAVFEPTHGSAPDIAGRGVANPVAAIRSAAMLAAWLGEAEIAGHIDSAVLAAVTDGVVNTPDVVGAGVSGTTESVTTEIMNYIIASRSTQ